MKKMNKTLAIAIAAAMVSPSAFAAQDTSGMQFTSASEGFYASIRARLGFSGGNGGYDNEGSAGINDNSSRLGVRGSNDLGGGLAGFYQWEGELSIADSDGPAIDRTRLGHVGLRGNFGELIVGAFWANDYNWTHGSTDIANQYSGNFDYNDQREGRTERAIQYSTPDLNGFQGAIRVDVGSNDSTVSPMAGFVPEIDGGLTEIAVTNDVVGRSDNDLDGWNIAAKYDIQGFSVGASYNNLPDRLPQVDIDTNNGDVLDVTGYDDLTSWTIKSGYAQDNWYVNAWYGEDNLSDVSPILDDTETFSIAGGVSVDKVNLYVLYETQEISANVAGVSVSQDTAYTTLGAQYNLGSNSRVWVEYFGRDVDGDTKVDDIVSIGLRHDF